MALSAMDMTQVERMGLEDFLTKLNRADGVGLTELDVEEAVRLLEQQWFESAGELASLDREACALLALPRNLGPAILRAFRKSERAYDVPLVYVPPGAEDAAELIAPADEPSVVAAPAAPAAGADLSSVINSIVERSSNSRFVVDGVKTLLKKSIDESGGDAKKSRTLRDTLKRVNAQSGVLDGGGGGGAHHDDAAQQQQLQQQQQQRHMEDEERKEPDDADSTPVRLEACGHTFGKGRLRRYVMEQVGQKKAAGMQCPDGACSAELDVKHIQDLLTADEFSQYLEATLLAFIEMDNLSFPCPNAKCGALIAYEPERQMEVPANITEKGDDGTVLTPETWLHFQQYRLRCRECQTVFCADCKRSPYHKGHTCEQFVDFQKARVCRFCGARITADNQAPPEAGGKPLGPGLRDVCSEEECLDKRKVSCDRIKECGCPCNGVRGEAEEECLPCLKHDLDCADEFCSICYVEALKDAPCIQLQNPDCGHIFHFNCMLQKVAARWPGARISFEFLNCPLCQRVMEHKALGEALAPVRKLQSQVETMALERLKYEGRMEDPAVVNANGRFHKDPKAFALHTYLFYMCFKCKRPYFAGGYECQEANAPFNPEELVCPSCQPQSKDDCPKHGKDWLAYKCKYCCSYANWYCFAEDHQILTEDGYAGLARLEAEPDLRVAAYDEATRQIVYQRATRVVVNPARDGQRLVEMTDERGRLSFGPDSGEEEPGGGLNVLATADHDMFVVPGRVHNGTFRAQPAQPRKVKAGELALMFGVGCDDDEDRAAAAERVFGSRSSARAPVGFASLTAADAGFAGAGPWQDLPPVARLGLGTEPQLVAFLELYGFWLGDGWLQFGGDSVAFGQAKAADHLAFLRERFETLGLADGVDVLCSERGGGRQAALLVKRPDYVSLFVEQHACKYLRGHDLEEALARHAVGGSGRRDAGEGHGVKSAKWCSPWVFDLRASHARALLRGLVLAGGRAAACPDGATGAGARTDAADDVFTSSARFRDEVVQLAHHAGHPVHFRRVRAAGTSASLGLATRDGFVVRICSGPTHRRAVSRSDRGGVRVVPYGGRTWCVSVPSGLVFVRRAAVDARTGEVRRASRGVVAGNCWGNSHFCGKCHVSGVWQKLSEFRTGKNKKKMWEYPQCEGLREQIDPIVADSRLTDEQRIAKLETLMSDPRRCPLGIPHPPNGVEFGLGCSMCEDKETEAKNRQAAERARKELEEKRKALGLVKEQLAKHKNGLRFTHRRDMDENGVLWYLGTRGRTTKWSNPADSGFVNLSSSGIMNDSVPLSHMVGREVVRCVTRPVRNAWMAVDLIDMSLELTHYTLRHYSSWDTECLRNWVLEASNDGGVSWDCLKVHRNDKGLNKKGGACTWAVESNGARYRAFRITQTDVNSNSHWYMAVSGCELYGMLFDSAAAAAGAGAPADEEEMKRAEQSQEIVRTFEHHYDFDENGILYFLGTMGGKTAWRNPAETGQVVAACSRLAERPASKPASAICGRSLVRCVSVAKPNQWFSVDLKDKKAVVTAYTVRHYDSWDSECLRNWKFEGSNDGVSWVVIRSHRNDESLQGKGGTHTWKVETEDAFSMFRIFQTGKNSNNHLYLACSGLELYGRLKQTPPVQIGRGGIERGYLYDFDCNGVLYYIGTRGLRQPWRNPAHAGLVVCSASNMAGQPQSHPPSAIAGRSLVRCVTAALPGQWMTVDLKDYSLQPTHYTLKHYLSWDTEALRNWVLEASVDGQQWKVLREHRNDAHLDKKGATFTWPLPLQQVAFRLFRIRQTGLNSNNHHYLSLSGCEFYGRLYDVHDSPQMLPAQPLAGQLVPPFKDGTVFKYAHDFDENGILFWLGTAGLTRPYRNPCEAGAMKVVSSPLASQSAPASAAAGRDVVRCVTHPRKSSFFVFDLGEIYVIPSAYTLRHYDSWDTEALRSWRLEGSHDGKKWKAISTHRKDKSLDAKGASASWAIKGVTKSYNKFRVIQTGKNSNKHFYLALSGFEIYGTIYSFRKKL